MAFYVTVRNYEQVGYLVGPFNRHGDALAYVEPARKAAEAVNSDARWFAYGTARTKTHRRYVGKLNDMVGYKWQEGDGQ